MYNDDSRRQSVKRWTPWASGPYLLMQWRLHSVRNRRRSPVLCGHWTPSTPATACTCTPYTHTGALDTATMSLNGLLCADVLLRNYSLTHSLTQLQYHHHCLCSCSVPITLFHKVSEQSNFTDCWQSSCTCYLIVMLRLQCIVILLKPRLPAPVILILFVFRVLAHLSKSNSRTFQGPYKGYISEGARIEASKAPR